MTITIDPTPGPNENYDICVSSDKLGAATLAVEFFNTATKMGDAGYIVDHSDENDSTYSQYSIFRMFYGTVHVACFILNNDQLLICLNSSPSDWSTVRRIEALKSGFNDLFAAIEASGVVLKLRPALAKSEKKHTNWFKKLFGESKPKTVLDEVQEVGGKMIVSGYRRIAASSGIAPSADTSDEEIIEIYKKVGTAFREASKQRGEQLQAEYINYIVWKFLQVKEMMGTEMLDAHLEYEVQKYIREGLRPDYKKDLKLF